MRWFWFVRRRALWSPEREMGELSNFCGSGQTRSHLSLPNHSSLLSQYLSHALLPPPSIDLTPPSTFFLPNTRSTPPSRRSTPPARPCLPSSSPLSQTPRSIHCLPSPALRVCRRSGGQEAAIDQADLHSTSYLLFSSLVHVLRG